MKKLLLLLFVSLMVLSCSVDGDSENRYYEILPIESYVIPATFEYGKVYDIDVFYKRPSACHLSATLYFEKKDSTRTIAIQSLVLDRSNCQPVPNEEPRKGSFKFEVLNKTPYVFKFFKGKDEAGENLFEEVIIPVVN